MRGKSEVVDTSLGSPPPCQSCHSAAKRFDLVCDVDHGCAPLPLRLDAPAIDALQKLDARCVRAP